MRSLHVIPTLTLILVALAGCSSGTAGSGEPLSPVDGPSTGTGSDGDSAGSPDLSWSIREVEFGGTATPSASVTVGGHRAWADGGSRWKSVIPSRVLDLEQGEDLELSATTADGGRRQERIGIQVQR